MIYVRLAFPCKSVRQLLTLIILMLTPLCSQEVSKVGTTAAQFLKIGVGAKALSMGGAFTAVANFCGLVISFRIEIPMLT